MQLNLEINNQAKSPVRKAFFEAVWKAAFKDKSLDLPAVQNFNLSLAFVSKAEIKKINRIWRKKNAVTDVLSFAEFKNLKEIKNKKGKEIFLGEIILCYDDIKAYARKNGLKINRELAQVFLHGILHLLGFRHGKIMFVLQNNFLNKVHKWNE